MIRKKFIANFLFAAIVTSFIACEKESVDTQASISNAFEESTLLSSAPFKVYDKNNEKFVAITVRSNDQATIDRLLAELSDVTLLEYQEEDLEKLKTEKYISQNYVLDVKQTNKITQNKTHLASTSKNIILDIEYDFSELLSKKRSRVKTAYALSKNNNRRASTTGWFYSSANVASVTTTPNADGAFIWNNTDYWLLSCLCRRYTTDINVYNSSSTNIWSKRVSGQLEMNSVVNTNSIRRVTAGIGTLYPGKKSTIQVLFIFQ